ncbi:MAG: asparagine synthase (glutamine-hydrolyzing) [Candidatus Brocadiaceae bacterium]|nr:asparagine synthase (glutamine-hydrolyzing) [Candidatus Brocadiaceae bacterium]
MCGIAGFFYLDNKRVAETSFIQQMTESLSHRGPDNRNYYRDNTVALGHQRLAVIDLSVFANQPLCNEDATVWTVFNGEIYNYRELRQKLKSRNHTFKTNSDTEVIVHSYEEWGLSCFDKIDGMMAVALYDKPGKKLILAKDRFGKKPLYYTLQNGIFAFASELKALKKHPHIKTTLSQRSVERYLAYEYVPTPDTIYENIFKLDAAQYLVVSTQGEKLSALSPVTYWNVPFEPKLDISLDEACGSFKELFIQAVEKRLISDVPLGVFLSGGIDSSSIVWAMSQVREAASIKTFSIGFEEKSFDESQHAQEVAAYFGTNHHSKIFDVNTLLKIMPDVLGFLDEPIADASILPTFLLSQFTREYVTVALGGDGGDELFAGYDPFIAHKIANVIELLPGPILKFGRWLSCQLPVSEKNMSFDFRARHFMKGFSAALKGSPELRNQVWLGAFGMDQLASCMNSAFTWEDIYRSTLTRTNKGLHEIDRLSDIYIKTYLHDDILVKIDRASMMNSLEVRTPFLDTQLAEFVARLPVQYKMRGLETKYLLRHAMKDLVPDFVLSRSKKGFGIPLSKWLRKELLSQSKEAIRALHVQMPDIFRQDELNKIISRHVNRKSDCRKEIWSMMMLRSICF